MVLLQLCHWTFSHKETLYQSLFDLSWFLFTKMTNSLFEPPFGGLSVDVRTSPIARWKAHSRLRIRDGWDVISRYWSKSALFRVGGSLWAQILGGSGRRPQPLLVPENYSVFATSQWGPHDPIFIYLDRVPACDRRTKLLWLIQRSALQELRPRCKTCGNTALRKAYNVKIMKE